MKKYVYSVCSLCKTEKDKNRSPYCKKCSREYGREYRVNKKLKPNVNIEGLEAFINKIKRGHYYIDFNDLNVILFFYEIISTDINEFDEFNSGKQIRLMWEKVLAYYEVNKR
jgi:hypothetical protein